MKNLIHIKSDSEIPLIGTIMFGCIDRGTNLIQVRGTTLCSLSCKYCSTDSGPFSKTRVTDYLVDPEPLAECLSEIALYKEEDIEAHIDSVGEPLTHPRIIDLVQKLRKIPQVKIISMQTHGTLLNKERIALLEKAGLSRINLSIDSLNQGLCEELTNTKDYNVNEIINAAKMIASSRIKLMLTPLWLPGINDEEIKKIIIFGKELNASFGIQNYLSYKHGRRVKKLKQASWDKFNKFLKKLEEEFNVKLILSEKDFNIHKVKQVPKAFKRGDVITAKVVAPGWMRNEMIGSYKNRALTIINTRKEIGSKAKVKILSNKHNIGLAREV